MAMKPGLKIGGLMKRLLKKKLKWIKEKCSDSLPCLAVKPHQLKTEGLASGKGEEHICFWG